MTAAGSGDLLQPGWRESTRTINGLNLHIVEAGDAGDPLLVLLHGFPEFWWAWRHQITPLAKAGYNVVGSCQSNGAVPAGGEFLPVRPL